MPGDPLADLVSSAARPLSFLRDADAAQRARTRLPVAAWLERIDRLGGGQPVLEELAAIFRRLDDAHARQENELLDRALALLRELSGRPAASSSAAPVEARTAKAVTRGRSAKTSRAAAVAPGSGGPSSAPASVEQVGTYLRAVAQPVVTLPGVGPQRSKDLGKFGLETIEDVLYHLPFRYEDRRRLAKVADLREGEAATVTLLLSGVHEQVVGRRRRRVLRVVGRDDSGLVELVWYHQIRYFRSRLKDGSSWLVHGRVERGYDTALRMVHPEMEPAAEGADGAPRIVPVYEKPTAMPASAMRRIAHAAIRGHAACIPDTLSTAHRDRLGLAPLADAFRSVHEPGPDQNVDELMRGTSAGHRAIIFDELFFVQLGLLLRKASVARQAGIAFSGAGTLLARLLRELPFELTGAQRRVLDEIGADMDAARPMHRLLQGDVGSGKTVIAVAAALRAIEAGYQAVLMAPTELLAEQHWRTVQKVAGGLDVGLWVLTGETPLADRRSALGALAEGQPGLAVGTHALIQEQVKFGRLGLAVIDEQHRFGVMQRAALSRAHGELPPDVLLMTATPIPRTMALSVYGDLDLSTIDELPPSRKPVATELYGVAQRGRAYDRVRREVSAGRQAYVVYPLVEESENSDLRDATSAAQELAAGPFSEFRVALVHGRMSAAERDVVMRAFRDGDYDILVATTVIEVGIDVPNASVIVVEHAERFGLSQLHQLRGRVGRGSDAAYCLLLADYAQSNDAKERLRVMTETSDGLRIAEADLEIRGPGALLGTRQAGVPDFRVASLLRDAAVLREARALAEEILAGDPTLSEPSSRPIAALLDARWAGRLGLARIG